MPAPVGVDWVSVPKVVTGRSHPSRRPYQRTRPAGPGHSSDRLAFTDVVPSAVTPALTQSANGDPDRSVRVSARYALHLIENRQ
jgi:hypothetical protein